MSKWIKTSERLPEANVSVLTFGWYDETIAGCDGIAWIQRDGKWYWDPKDEPVRCLTDEGEEVTHWMPLPEPPKP